MTAVATPRVRANAGHGVAQAWSGVRVVVHWLPLAALLGGVALLHALNMANFPYYENDEGTYLSQAWAMVNEGRLAPYTYWYDHAPAGWMQVAVWSLLTGGFFSFGTSVETGRVLMLVYQVLSALLVYRIARVATGSWVAAALAVALFGFSALGIYLHRRVLLDNIATFWMLVSFALLVGHRPPSLARVWASAAALGVSILSKEVTVFLVPALAFLVWVRAYPMQRWLATVGWLAIVGSLVSFYVLMAILKGELFPTGTLFGGTHPHVSLLGTLEFQAARGRDGGLFDPSSGFWTAARGWAAGEPLLIVGGTAAAFLSLAWIRSRPVIAVTGLSCLSLWLFLARGGIVIGFYVIPLLPLLALSIGMVTWAATGRLATAVRRRAARRMIRPAMRGAVVLTTLAVLVSGYFAPYLGFASRPLQLWEADEAGAQRDALVWIREHVPPTSSLVIDNYAWLDLRAPTEAPAYELAHYYWKVGADPEITLGAFEGDWRSADYIMVTPQVVGDAGDPSLVLVSNILDHATRIVSFDGWPVSLRRVDKLQRLPATSDTMLASLWTDIRAAALDDNESSPADAVLLQAVYMNDRRAFDDLLARAGEPDAAQLGARAFALLAAGQRWDEPALSAAGSVLAGRLWDTRTVQAGRQRVPITSADGGLLTVAMSDLAPEQYRLFATSDPSHDWGLLVDSAYSIIDKAFSRPEHQGQAGVLPDQVIVDAATGKVVTWGDELTDQGTSVAWHLTLDWLWSEDERALDALRQLDVPRNAFAEHGRIVDRYGVDGTPHSDRETMGTYVSLLGTMLAGPDPEAAHRVLGQKVLEPVLAANVPVTHSERVLAWYATALLDGGLADVSGGSRVIAWPEILTPARAVSPAS